MLAVKMYALVVLLVFSTSLVSSKPHGHEKHIAEVMETFDKLRVDVSGVQSGVDALRGDVSDIKRLLMNITSAMARLASSEPVAISPSPEAPTISNPATSPTQQPTRSRRFQAWIADIGRPQNWTSFPERGESSCFYKRFLTRGTFFQAERVCKRHRSHLASIHSAEEQAFVKNQLIGNTFDRIWIGGNDRRVEGRWEWTDGTPFGEFTYWKPNEPNSNGGNEDCLEANFGSVRKWNDESCYSRLAGFVCKRCEIYRTLPRGFFYPSDFDLAVLEG